MRILLEEEHILDYVEESINNALTDPIEVIDDRFHHNTKYKDAVSVIKNGILSISELNKMGHEEYSDEVVESLSDIESHANGSESISLAVVGLTDLMPDEFEYNPFSEKHVDIIITRDIMARRVTTNYGNEYLSDESIYTDKFRAIDTRLLSFVQSIREKSNEESYKYSVTELLESYNQLRKMAKVLKERKLEIPLREMSSSNAYALDIDRVSNMPKIKIKS